MDTEDGHLARSGPGHLPRGAGHRPGLDESHARWRDRSLRDIVARMRHDRGGGLAAKAELLTGIEGVSSRPVRRIVLIDGA
jgi:hypothetical protein